MKAKDVMTPRVISIAPEATITEGVRLMLQNRISGLPVVDKAGNLVGIVTEGDFLRRAETGTERHRPRWLEFILGPGKLAGEYAHAHGRKIAEVMTTEPTTVTEDTPLDEVVQLMEKRRIKRVPVVRGVALVGIISRANLLHALASVARETKPASAEDAAIRERLMKELAEQRWAPLALIDVVVRNGVVEFWGTVTDDRERQALIVAAENIAGVKEVRDHLAWIEPVSGMVIPEAGSQSPQARAS
jgi:CBS domain-containing protein